MQNRGEGGPPVGAEATVLAVFSFHTCVPEPKGTAASPHLQGLSAQCPVSLQPAGRRRNEQVKGHRVPALGRPRAEMGPFTPCLLARAGAEKPHCHQRSGLRAPNPCQRSRTGLVDLGTAGQGKGTVPSSVSAPRRPWPPPARGQQHPLPSVTTIETSHCQGLPGVRRHPQLRTIILEGKNTETST